MPTLWLLRHAKSSWADEGTPDHERPLNARGREGAARVGARLARREVSLDRVLCSSAQRTRETLEILVAQLPEPPPSETRRELYLASAGDLFSLLQDEPDTAENVMVIAHNPGIAQLAGLLARTGSAALREEMLRKYPTGGLAELRLEAPAWRSLDQGCELVSFEIPRKLPAVS